MTDEQARIASEAIRRTERVDQIVEQVGTQLERLQEYRQALITAAVTGQIDVSSEVTP